MFCLRPRRHGNQCRSWSSSVIPPTRAGKVAGQPCHFAYSVRECQIAIATEQDRPPLVSGPSATRFATPRHAASTTTLSNLAKLLAPQVMKPVTGAGWGGLTARDHARPQN
jgi:hypothetical protein